MSVSILEPRDIQYLCEMAAIKPDFSWCRVADGHAIDRIMRRDLAGALIVQLSALGQILVDDNYASYNARYDDNLKPFRYVHHSQAVDHKPGEVFAACNYYEYQASEHPEGMNCEGLQVIGAIRAQSMRHVIASQSKNPTGTPDHFGNSTAVCLSRLIG